MKKNVAECPLCQNHHTHKYSEDKLRSYYQCPSCQLVFVARDELISFDKEKERYEAHENDASDAGYSAYLKNIADLITPFLKSGSRGLDFGCGRTTALASYLTQAGHKTESYDAYFFKNESIWDESYDFIVLSEVIEHLRGPRQEMRELAKRLKPNGKIFIKTKLMPNSKAEFDQWFYKRDITHVQFFSEQSMEYLRNYLAMDTLETIGTDLYFMDRK